jgi:serine/threonine-protein kinase
MEHEALIGRKVAGRFTIKRVIGEGGMATVFAAEHEGEEREIALKVMHTELTRERSFVKRFEREARAASRVRHESSVRIIEYGVADGLSYIAMELLAGDDLYVVLERGGALTQRRAARILVEVCEALVVAHGLGIVHRDLKPENIMLLPDPTHPEGERVKVLDFGIAKILGPEIVTAEETEEGLSRNTAVTRFGTFLGTPAYMSPEQCMQRPIDGRADIYTCGVLLFQLVTGRLPFEGVSPTHTAELHVSEPPPRPRTLAPSIDGRLEALILRALAKKPVDRHPTARHLGSALRSLLADLPDVVVAQVPKPISPSYRPSWRVPRAAAANESSVPPTPIGTPPMAPEAPRSPPCDGPTPTQLVIRAKATRTEVLEVDDSWPTPLSTPSRALTFTAPLPTPSSDPMTLATPEAAPPPPTVAARPELHVPRKAAGSALPFPVAKTIPMASPKAAEAVKEPVTTSPSGMLPPRSEADPPPMTNERLAPAPLLPPFELAAWEAAPEPSPIQLTGLGGFVLGLATGVLVTSVVVVVRTLWAGN